MRLLEFTVTRPYPRQRLFDGITLVLFVLLVPILTLLNITTVGYELVPTLRPVFKPNDTTPEWWTKAKLPKFMRGSVQPCQPQDIGRGDFLRVSPGLFEYKVLSSWQGVHNVSFINSTNEGSLEYRGEPFNKCDVYSIGFDFNLLDLTQTFSVAIICPESPIVAYMESRIVFAEEYSKDHVGQYYGRNNDLTWFINGTSRDYRESVFGILDVITGDSFAILRGQYLASPVLSVSASAVFSLGAKFETASAVYVNGTVSRAPGNNTLGELEIYRETLENVVFAVHDAVQLDLGSATSDNIFIDSSALNRTFTPNLRPGATPNDPPGSWDTIPDSFYYGLVPSPYRTWAEALLSGQPASIHLGNLTNLPVNSTMITNYLCPSYELKSTGTLITAVFLATATMLMSIWPVWTFLTGIVAQKIKPHGVVEYKDEPATPGVTEKDASLYEYGTLKQGSGAEYHVPLLTSRA